MKAREPRKRVATAARMKTNAGWSDVTIRDISSRGLGLSCSAAPPRGEYIELCRHHYRLIGRVIWSDGETFGVLLSDAIVADDLLSSRAPHGRQSGDRRVLARQQALRTSRDPRVAVVSVAQNSRHAARLMHFVAVAAIACIGAVFAASLATSLLSRAADAVSAGLQTNRAQLPASQRGPLDPAFRPGD